MKLNAREIESFLNNPNPDVKAVLIYGPDHGLVHERARVLLSRHTSDMSDPFLVAELSAKDIRDDPARLADESQSQSLTGGDRAVWVRDVTDSLAGSFASLIKDGDFLNLIVAEAGDLSPRSKLRNVFETSSCGAAMGCYLDDSRTIEAMAAKSMAECGVEISPDALKFLSRQLGNDRLTSRQEIDKLVLFAGVGGRLELSDVEMALGDSAVHTIEGVIYAAMEGDAPGLDYAFQGALAAGVSAVGLLRATQLHVQRLHLVLAKLNAGMSMDAAVRELRPPVFFKFKQRFLRQCQRWNEELAVGAMSLLLEGEARCKSSGIPVNATCHLSLMKICTAARKLR